MEYQQEILDLLIKEKTISEEDLYEIKKIANIVGGDITDILIERNIIDEEKIIELKAKVYGLQYQGILENAITSDVLNFVPQTVAENYKIICFDRAEDIAKIGITDPDNFKAKEAIDFLAKKSSVKIEFFLISKTTFLKLFKQYKNLEKEVFSALKIKEEQEREGVDKNEENEDFIDSRVIKSAPVSKIVSVIIRHAVEGKASDVHIEPWQNNTRIRYRIDGILCTSLTLPLNIHNSLVARIKVLAALKLDETRIPQDGRIRITVNKKEVDFRISIFPLAGYEKVVMRILSVAKKVPTLEDLGYRENTNKVIQKNIKKTSGMLLVTGPTGSGKSTTLFSILHILNKENVNISTLEDPVEYSIKGVNQSQVRPEIGFTFAAGLRSLLRQDPDIIMIGEIRDNETAELAIHAALTGHLVLSTLHTNSAISTIPRLFDMDIEPFLLGSTLNAVVAQRLARKICKHCKKEDDNVSPHMVEKVRSEINKMPRELRKKIPLKLVFYKGAGCSRCNNSGYDGRIAIVEALDVNSQIKDKILNGVKDITRTEVRKKQNFITMQQDGILKILDGESTMEEVLRVSAE